jgi:CheY-like chemotaxis protein
MLPLAQSVAQPEDAESSVDFDGRGRIVLLVEDETAVRQLAARILRTHRYRVIEARNGVEALEAVDGRHVDVVVTDVVMPRMSGYELARKLETRMPAAQIVFMSGYTPDAARPDGYHPPERFVLRKPFVAARLLELVGRAVAAGRSAR